MNLYRVIGRGYLREAIYQGVRAEKGFCVVWEDLGAGWLEESPLWAHDKPLALFIGGIGGQPGGRDERAAGYLYTGSTAGMAFGSACG
jgi:hypothetical protein